MYLNQHRIQKTDRCLKLVRHPRVRVLEPSFGSKSFSRVLCGLAYFNVLEWRKVVAVG